MTISHATYYLKGIVVTGSNGDATNVSIKSGGGTISKTQTQFHWVAGNNNTNSVSFNYASGSQYRINRISIVYETGGSTVETCAAPQFSPDGGSSTTGSLDVTITSATEGATIYYTTDNTDPVVNRSSIANGGTVTLTESCTLKAMAVKSGMDNSTIATSQSYTITSSGGSTIYRKVTSSSALTTGDYLIVYEDGSVAFDGSLTSLDGTNNIQSVTISNNTIETSQPIYFTYNATAGTLKSSSGYYIGRTANSNGLETSQTDPYTNTITIDNSGNAVITSSGGPTLRYNSASNQKRFRYYGSGQQAIQLYKKDSTDPTLLATPTSLPLADIPIDGTSTSGTFHLAGTHLTGDVSLSVSGADFSVSPTTISPVNGSVDQDITVTYGGTSTTEVTATVTITCGTATETVTVTAKKATPPPASITVNPSTLTINDSGTGNTFTVEGSNLGSDNVGVTQTNNNFTPTLKATTGTTYDGGSYRGFTPAGGEVNGTVAMSYTGRELSASNTVTLSNNLTSATVTVNYIADLYIVTDNGVTGDWHFDGTYGVPMTYNNGIYSAAFTVNNPNTYILFARKTGEGVTWNTRYVFGPNSSGDWDLPSSGNGGGSIDLNDDDAIKIQGTGTYIITINANTGAFTIEKEVVNTGDFVLVTEISQLNASDEVIFVDRGQQGSGLAMSTTQNSNNRGTTAVTVTPALKVAATAETQIATLEGDATSGWYFNVGNGYLYAASSSKNYLRTQTTKDDNARALIEFNNGVPTITFQGDYTHNQMRFNGDIVSCYASGLQPVYIYKRGVAKPTIKVNPTSLEFVIPAGGTSQEKTAAVTETNTTGTTSVEISGDGASNFTASLSNGTLTVTYNGTATQANPDVATVTLTNGEATATVDVTGYKLPITVTITPASSTFSGSTMSGITLESNVTGATLEYRVDGGQWMTYSEAFAITASTVGQIVTVEARATYNGETATATGTYTRVAKSNTLFEKVTKSSQIKANNKYILVYEGTPEALNGVTTGGTGVAVEWHGTNVVDKAGTNAIEFTLNGTANSAVLSCNLNGSTYYLEPGDAPALDLVGESTSGYEWTIEENNGGYVLKWGNYMMRYNSGSSAANGRFRIYDGTTGTPVYLYVQGGTIQAPEITPATGTYYEDQTVSISDESDDVTIWYTTDGSDPATSATRIRYNGQFTAPYAAGTETTIIAVAIDEEDNVSEPATVTYTWGVPTATIAPATGNVATDEVTVAITGTPAGAVIYYTTDGNTPTTESEQYNGAFPVELPNIGDEVTVKAIAVYNGVTSEVATATYTRVDKVIDVNAPFFSPLQNQTYYGDQTLQMGCTTPNADIHYEIIEVSGEEAPNAAYVNNPNNVSTVYTQPINMTVGHSYYVKAIAYIGSFASTVSEGWYVIKPFQGGNHVYQNLKDFNDNCPTGVTATFANPVQVVYHSTYTNNGEFAEYCYLRDNTDYACVYFGKRDTHDYTIFKMGDWIDGSQIAGVTNIWERNFHIQLGTGGHEVTSWPSQTIGWSEILPEEITNATIVAGTADGSNSWGHYVHLRNTTLRNVQDYGDDDPKHTGLINDGTVDAYYYDKFYRWSAGTCSYNGHNDVIQHLGDYDQAFFTAKQDAGATFDVYGIVDYYSGYNPPFEICPIDFLWIYQPVITVPSNDQCTAPFTTTITVAQPEWTDIAPTIYYKTNEMEDWEEYTPGQLISISSTTTVMTYAEVPAQKTDGTNYNDYLRSLTETAEYVFPAVKDPMITPPGETYDLNVTSSVDVTVQTNPESSTGTVTYYTLDGSDPRTSETRIELTSENGTFTVSENTTVNAASCLEMNGNTIWSNVVSETYQFIENDNKVYDLLKTAPVVGNIYVIVNKADNVGLSTTQNATNRAATGVMYVDANTKEQVKGNTHLATFVLEAATAGRYYFRGLNTNDYLCVNTNANPNLVTDARGSYAEATVTVNSGITSGVDESYPATVMMSYDGTRRYMRYYSAGRTFTTYDAATTNQDIFLYGLAPAELLPPSITPGDQLVQVVTGDEHVDATISTNYGDASTHTVYTTDGSDPRYSSTAVEFDDPAIILGYINTNTTVRAASYIEYEGDVIWSEPVKATYTFIGIKEPTITPASGLFVDGTTVNVTITTNPQNTQEGVQTYYTTDGTDPRTNGTLINGNSTTLPVTGNTTVQAASCVVVDGQTLWSIVVSETYEFTTPTPLCDIEKTGVKNNDYIVADELIGAWAVCDGNTKLLWAKDKDYPANDLRPARTTNQGDYVKELLKYQNDPWDESNWVVLDMSGVTMSPEDLVGQTIKPATIVGKYTDDVNYTIKLSQNPTPNGAVDDKNYTGWTENFEPVGKYYDRSYNTYVPANFMAEGDAVNNLNRIDDVTKYVVGAVAGDFALAGCQGDSLYFVNPKIQEVARIWGVWNGNDQFTIYEVGRDTVNSKVTNINAWDIKGCFNVVWDYNRVDLAYDYHKPNHLVIGEAYEFHAAIRKPVSANGSKRTKPVPDSETDPSSNYEIYPLDMSEDPVPTAVREALMPKTVIGVTYFNLMGQESSHPYEGINIVVTRYSDGSTSAVKVLR